MQRKLLVRDVHSILPRDGQLQAKLVLATRQISELLHCRPRSASHPYMELVATLTAHVPPAVACEYLEEKKLTRADGPMSTAALQVDRRRGGVCAADQNGDGERRARKWLATKLDV